MPRTMARIKRPGSKFLFLVIICLGIVCLTACQGSKTQAESYWNSAKKEKSLEDYLAKNRSSIDTESLYAEAVSAETLEQQFKATALLCALEYGIYKKNGDPDNSIGEMAKSFFSKVLTEEDFWEVLNASFYPYDCFEPMLRAAGTLDGNVISKLLEDIPEDAGYARELKDLIDTWIEENPASLSSIGDELIAIGYFDDWTTFDFDKTYFYNYVDGDPIRTDTIDEGIAYISYLRESMLPMLEDKFGSDDFKSPSNVDGEDYYSTKLAVVTEELLSLKTSTTEELPETIETEGKKVIAFYRNFASQQWEGSPAPLRILGDFMLDLPESEYPASLAEADYYLVLTPAYEYGGFYTDHYSGSETGIQEIWSNTSIDLYEAGTGNYLRHLGNVIEQASSSIVSSEMEALVYPELTSSDVLSYIYHNLNDPDAYISLVDQTEGQVEFEREESVILGSWEVTYHSSQVSESFGNSLKTYEAENGCQYVRAAFTITNVGFQRETFQQDLLRGTSDDISVLIADATFENYYDPVNSLTLFLYHDSLSNTSLDPGETKDGVLVFKVPDNVLEGADGLYIVIIRGYQIIVYPLE